jgi:hypothetical protein
MQTYHRLDDVHMSPIERERAKAHMQSAELTIDFIFAAVKKARAIGAAVRRRLIGMRVAAPTYGPAEQ